ncbi:hypothetical protein BC938DRAFT_482737 [Jimgerdemannia flammicorona]|uniref:Uncharacterized protein n=1 Tax=Jimgerdemannia flammicorona TaxID=994334 RepID=A0A433QDB4_9FUNG|nr:hypothetical protein BC938DRAFT_482737 [Jimgerdemannia flammicorona]
MRDELAALAGGDLDLLAGDNGAGKGSTEKVDSLVDRVGLNGGVDNFLDELFLEILREEKWKRYEK